MVYHANELFALDTHNNSVKIFAKGKQWKYFRSIEPQGIDVRHAFD